MISLTISGPNQLDKVPTLNIPCKLGRQPDASNPDLTIADPFVSRKHIQIEKPPSGNQLEVQCIGSSPIVVSDGITIDPGETKTVDLPTELIVGRSTIKVEVLDPGVSFIKPAATMIGGNPEIGDETFGFAQPDEVSPNRLIEWFERLISLQESVTSVDGFFEQAARAVVEMIGLDRCVVIDCKDELNIEAEHGNKKSEGSVYSQSVVKHALEYKQTVFDNTVDFAAARSLQGVSAFVASPIFDPDGNVIACLFGARDLTTIDVNGQGIQPMEAQLVQVIAGIVGSRLARLAAEAEQTRTQVQLEQFASPQLVREMQNNPQWLDARQRELTIMFGDIRGFSKLGLRLSADEIYELVRDTMDTMTRVIHDHGGFVFNFAGDGIAAMWNAPGENELHAQDACRAAVEIQKALVEVDKKWSQDHATNVNVGLGVNTGPALVGNSGSKLRLKYSPLGHEVNLASRIEGATKQFGVSILVTEATAKRIDQDFLLRDLGEIVVVGINKPTRVFQLSTSADTHTSDSWNEYAQAMRHYESGALDSASKVLEELLSRHGDDTPSMILRDRIASSDGTAKPWVLGDK